MKRTRRLPSRRGLADAILVSDIHLTDSQPPCRTDDYIVAQANKLAYLGNVQAQHQCPILCGGDVFHKWKASPWLLTWAYLHLPTPMIVIAGNHDLPEHSMERYEESALYNLETTLGVDGCFKVLKDYPAEYTLKGRKVVFRHELIWPESHRALYNLAGGLMATDVIAEHSDADLILTGDNHTPFVEDNGRTILVNPGSMMRSTADQVDHKPRMYLYYANDNTVEPVFFPIEPNAVNREHIEQQTEREDRITAYIEKMKMNWEVGLSFRQNLEAFFQKNNTPQKVRELIWSHLE